MKIFKKTYLRILLSVVFAEIAICYDTSNRDTELYYPVKETLIDSYLPKNKDIHLGMGNFHPMKIYVDYSRITDLKQTDIKTWNLLTKTLIPTLTKHLSSTYSVPEAQNVQVTVDSCYEAKNTVNTVPENINVDFVIIFFANLSKDSGFYATCGSC